MVGVCPCEAPPAYSLSPYTPHLPVFSVQYRVCSTDLLAWRTGLSSIQGCTPTPVWDQSSLSSAASILDPRPSVPPPGPAAGEHVSTGSTPSELHGSPQLCWQGKWSAGLLPVVLWCPHPWHTDHIGQRINGVASSSHFECPLFPHLQILTSDCGNMATGGPPLLGSWSFCPWQYPQVDQGDGGLCVN